MQTEREPSESPSGMEPDRVEVRVLGPLRVRARGVDLDVGPPRSRTVFAVLVSEFGRLVSTDRLIDGIYGDEPPRTAKKALHVHISNLRRALGDDVPIRTAPGGYVLQSAGVEVDSVAFEAAVGSATRLLRTDAAAASRLLSESLAMWEGAAYADFSDQPAMTAEITRLGEVRLHAVETRIDADLRLGRHGEVVSELETLTIDHPYRERLRELHMLALYRSGRQAEALRAYEHTRVVLAEELGLEPTPALRDLQHQILSQSGDLDLVEIGTERYAFLASDLEGSTALWDAEPDLMQRALERHDAILHDAIGEHGGHVFKHTGDGVLAVFATFSDSVEAAVSAQVELTGSEWPTSRPLRVRMAVDEGAAVRRGDDYFGPAMNRVNRVMASGHGGQVLLPEALRSASPVEAVLLGPADYKGLGRIEVAQLVVDGLPREFPELRTERTASRVERVGFGRSIRGYELRERLGEGAHGQVFRAYQASIGREVAVKVIRPEHASRTDFVKRFEAEAQFVAQLEHPHIVSLHDYWRDSEGAYLIMQLLRGGSLASALERAPWRPPAAMQLLEQVGAGLDYAHRHGVVHRDLKPSNVLLDDDGNAFLSDFGIAVDSVDAVTFDATAAPAESSAAYVSPEELAGLKFGAPADVYGLGLLTYEMFTGHRPALGGQPEPLSRHRHDLPIGLDDVLARATDPDPDQRYPRIEDYLRALRQAFGADVVSGRVPTAPADVRNPFKGLRAFAEIDAQDFYGREELTDELVHHVASHALTAVVGPSGCGKSSLVRAGLLPAVRRGEIATGGDVLITEMYPGAFPFEELEAALTRVAVRGEDTLLPDLLADERGLLRACKQLLPDDHCELLLIVDQFEELFSLTTDAHARQLFLASLVTAVGDPRSRIRVVVTMRADFLDRPLAVADFGAVLGASLIPVAMPTREQLTEAIARPASGAGLEMESGLVPRIVADVVDEPGALPLLQHALTELFAERSGSRLTADAYVRTGGVRGALASRAEEIYTALSAPTQVVAREVFLRLVNVDDDSDDTRRRVRRTELESLGLGDAALESVLSQYGSFRLLSFDRDPTTRGPTVEVAHEALIREWPRFRTWVDDRREDLLLERRLDTAAHEWEDNGRDPSFLFRAGRLEQYEQWMDDSDTRVTTSERDFLDAGRANEDDMNRRARTRRRGVLAVVSSLALLALVAAAIALVQRNDANDEAERAREQEQLALEQEQIAKGARDDEAEARNAEATALEAAETARDEAEREALESTVRSMAFRAQELIETDPEAAMLLAIEAADVSASEDIDIPEVMSALIETTVANPIVSTFALRPTPSTEFGTAMSSAPDSERVVALLPDGRNSGAGIVDARTGEVLRDLDEVVSPVSVHWDHERNEVFVGNRLGEVSVWNPDTGERIATFDGGGSRARVIGTSDSTIGLGVGDSGSSDRMAVVLHRDTGERIIEHEGPAIARPSPSGNYAVVIESSNIMHGYDLRTGELLWTLPFVGRSTSENAGFDWVPGEDAVWSVREPDLVRVDLATGAETIATSGSGNGNWFAGLRPWVSPDGQRLAMVGLGAVVSILDIAELDDPDLTPEVELERDEGGFVAEVAWLADGSGLVGVANDGTATLWDLEGTASATETIPLDGYPAETSFLGDGRLLTFDFPGSAEIRDAATGDLLTPGGSGSVAARVFDVLGATRPLLARSNGEGEGLEVLDMETGELLLDIATPMDHPIALSEDGELLLASNVIPVATFANPPEFALVRVADGQRVVEQEGLVAGAAFSPDGTRLAVHAEMVEESSVPGSPTPQLLVYDTTSGEVIERIPTASTADFDAVEFSPDGALLGVAEAVGNEVLVYDLARLLDDATNDPDDAVVARGALPVQISASALDFSEDGSIVVVSQFSPDGAVAAFDVENGGAALWEFEVGELVVDVDVHDDLYWYPQRTSSGIVLNAMPIDRAAYTEFARSRATRGLSAIECAVYLGVRCPRPTRD